MKYDTKRTLKVQYQNNEAQARYEQKRSIQKKNLGGGEFFAHVQTGPGAHPNSCTMGAGSFPGVKRPGRGTDHPPNSSAEVENE
jgi:hypothetical protein